MAIRGSFIPARQPLGFPEFAPNGSSPAAAPFRVTNTTANKVIIEPYSCLLENFDIKTNIPICGLNYEFKLLYGEKIYLETVFDVNGQVAYSRIDHEASWLIQTKNPSTSDGKGQLVYPSLMAVLNKGDAGFYAAYIKDQQQRVQAQKNEDHQYWEAKINQYNQNGDNVNAQKATTTQTQHDKNYQNALDKLTTMADSKYQQNFFSNVTSIRRQVSAYNLIAYTTKNPEASTNLNATSITPPNEDLSGDEDPDSDDVMKKPLFYVVQNLNKDLMLMDVDFNRTACRYPIEFSRPVYYFLDTDTQKAEDDEQVTSNTDNTAG